MLTSCMRYAIVSDIHANLQAWNAVLLDIRSARVDKIICLGDIIGYGPRPADVLESVYTNVDHFVLGNHDAAVCGKLDTLLFNENARECIAWTAEQLNEDAVLFLHDLPLSLRADGFRCTHGDFSDPASFHYIIEPEEAVPSWQAVDERVLFTGHTHRPAIFLLGPSNVPRMVEPQDFELEPNKRFLINVGSVGCPRNGYTGSTYCIYDSDRAAVYWRQIVFDLDAYRADMEAVQLSLESSAFLRHDPRQQVAPLREQLNFSPPEDEEHRVHDVVEVAEVAALKQKAVRWKLLFWAFFGAAFLIVAGVTAIEMRRQTRKEVLQEPMLTPAAAVTVRPGGELLPIPSEPISPGGLVPEWRVVLGDKRKQSVSFVTAGDLPHFLLSSSTHRHELVLESRPLTVKPDMRFCMQVAFKKSPGFTGTAGASILFVPTGASTTKPPQSLFYKEPNMKRKGDRLLAKKTFDVPPNAEIIIFRVHGSFKGTIQVSDISLLRKE